MDRSPNKENKVKQEPGLLVTMAEAFDDIIDNENTDSMEHKCETRLVISNDFGEISDLAREPQSLLDEYQYVNQQAGKSFEAEIEYANIKIEQEGESHESELNDPLVTGYPNSFTDEDFIVCKTEPIEFVDTCQGGAVDEIAVSTVSEEPASPLLKYGDPPTEPFHTDPQVIYLANERARSAERRLWAIQITELEIQHMNAEILLKELKQQTPK